MLRWIDGSWFGPWKRQKQATGEVRHGGEKVFGDVWREWCVVAELETVDDGDESVLGSVQGRAQVGFDRAHVEVM